MLKCVVSAKSTNGPVEWPVDHVLVVVEDSPPPNGARSDLNLAFAHARISELLDSRDAIERRELPAHRPSLRSSRRRREEEEEAEPVNFEAARAMALDAGLVWPGLTALVTKENESCPQFTFEACHAGNGKKSELDRGHLRAESKSAGYSLQQGFSLPNNNDNNNFVELMALDSACSGSVVGCYLGIVATSLVVALVVGLFIRRRKQRTH